MLDEIIERLQSKKGNEIDEIRKKLISKPFIPNPGPQTDAYYSEADVLLYGGAPGGGKSALEIGLALNEHYRTLLVRKAFTDLEGLIDTAKKLVGSSDGFIGGSRPKYKKPDGGVIHFAGLAEDGGIGSHQGVDHDLICCDECAQIPEKQVRLLLGWLRTDKPGQRCRMVLGSNPPIDSTGDWLIDFFAPWINPNHPDPAKPGELRYFLPGEDGKDRECEKGDSVEINGVKVYAQSRTYIPSQFTDNPYYTPEEYAKSLSSLPNEVREILVTGNFMLARTDQSHQLIPTDWVRQAQKRWKSVPPPNTPMTAIGVDVAAGGNDKTVLACRYDGWYAPLVSVPGVQTPNPSDVAGLVIAHRKDRAQVVIDMGGGYGGGPLEHLRNNIGSEYVTGCVPGSGAVGRTEDRQLGFFNRRSQIWWEFREALDPAKSFVSLPDDPELVADLTAPTFEIVGGKIKVESKGDGVGSDGKPKPGLCKRLGRSPDKGDAVVMAFSEGDKALTAYIQHNVPIHRYGNRDLSSGPKINHGYSNRRK